jgi:DNA-binding transcriptional regulator YbjK
MSLKIAFCAIAAVSLGANAYQYLTNRGLKKMLNDSGISTESKCAILKKAVADLEGDLTSLKADLNVLIDDITSGKISAADIGERVMEVYRKASKEKEAAKAADADAKAPEAPKSAEAPAADSPNTEKPADAN